MSWRGLRKTNNIITGYGNISSFSTFRVYMRDTNNVTTDLEISTNCSLGAEFCLKKSALNTKAKIFGNSYDPQTYTKFLMFEQVWCNTTNALICPSTGGYSL
jgi:hypothetical protein